MDNLFEKLNTPIISASGCWASTEEQIVELLNSNIGAITLKTCTLFSKDGNKEPNFYRDGEITFNSKGLPNKGYSYYRDILIKYNIEGNKPFIVSVSYESNDKINIILDDINGISVKNTFVELNLSCPNIKCDDGIIGYNLDQISILLDNLKNYDNLTIGLKLPPYLDIILIKNLCHILNKNLKIIKFITLCNSIPNTIHLYNQEPVLSTLLGGMSGKINKYISLGNISLFNNYLDKRITIIGCGGISNLCDILDYEKMGVKYYQIASYFYDENNNKLDIENINLLIESYNFYKK